MNIYAPCDNRRKTCLCDKLSERTKENNGEQICVLRYFNSIRVEEERI